MLARAKTEPVVWHAHRNNELMYGMWLRLRCPKLKLVFTRHGGEPPGAFTRWLASGADAVVTLNAESQQLMGVPSEVIPHGVDLKRFQPPNSSRAAAWKKLGQDGKYGIGVVGRVRPAKGQADFVGALSPPMPNLPDWKPVLVGAVRPVDQLFAKEQVERPLAERSCRSRPSERSGCNL